MQDTQFKPQKVFALVDCNAFFCSCERLFRPDLKKSPVGVLSNNDGCFVSRTKELKALGVQMGAPYFKVKDICIKHNVAVFSSNFSLYTNMSDRVMQTLANFSPEMEVYSVDEAFLDLTGFSPNDLNEYAKTIKDTVERNTGIPVSIGIGSTKTLAKLANHIAKTSDRANGIVSLLNKEHLDIALSRVKVNDIWGVGKATTTKLNAIGITTAKEFRDYSNDRLILKTFTKVGLMTKEELMGKSRFKLEIVPPKKKEIICSRTFGAPVFDVHSLRESVANYVSSACEKLRKQKSVTSSVEVFIHTSPFKNVSQYFAIEPAIMLSATSDTRKVIRHAFKILDHLFKSGYEYKKAGIKLSQILDKNQSQMSLLDQPDTVKSDKLMVCLDTINARDGVGTIKVGSCGTNNKAWRMNRNMKSPRFVTGWSELPKVK